MEKIKRIGKAVYWLIIVVLIVVAGLTAFSTLNIKNNYKLMVVLSGSMEPTIKTGSIVVVKSEADYKVNEIVTFKEEKSSVSTTHRIVKVKRDKNGTSYTTKGDANNAPDLKPLNKGNILGKVFFSVPFIGYAVEFMKTKTGLLVIIVLAALIIFNEVTNVKKESLRLIQARKQRKLNVEEKIEEKLDEEIIKTEKKVKKVIKKKKRKKKNV